MNLSAKSSMIKAVINRATTIVDIINALNIVSIRDFLSSLSLTGLVKKKTVCSFKELMSSPPLLIIF